MTTGGHSPGRQGSPPSAPPISCLARSTGLHSSVERAAVCLQVHPQYQALRFLSVCRVRPGIRPDGGRAAVEPAEHQGPERRSACWHHDHVSGDVCQSY